MIIINVYVSKWSPQEEFCSSHNVSQAALKFSIGTWQHCHPRVCVLSTWQYCILCVCTFFVCVLLWDQGSIAFHVCVYFLHGNIAFRALLSSWTFPSTFASLAFINCNWWWLKGQCNGLVLGISFLWYSCIFRDLSLVSDNFNFAD